MVKAVSKKVYWSDGWIAIRNMLHNDSKDMLPEHLDRLRALEEILHPSTFFKRHMHISFLNLVVCLTSRLASKMLVTVMKR